MDTNHHSASPPEEAPLRAPHWPILILCSAAIALSFLLEVRQSEKVEVFGISGANLPPLCMSRLYFDIPCPGCGLTRSFVHLAHGRWQAAWATNRLGWLVFAAALLQIPYRLHALYNNGKEALPAWISGAVGIGLLFLLSISWTLQQFGW